LYLVWQRSNLEKKSKTFQNRYLMIGGNVRLSFFLG
jgi:hypothetical protein